MLLRESIKQIMDGADDIGFAEPQKDTANAVTALTNYFQFNRDVTNNIKILSYTVSLFYTFEDSDSIPNTIPSIDIYDISRVLEKHYLPTGIIKDNALSITRSRQTYRYDNRLFQYFIYDFLGFFTLRLVLEKHPEIKKDNKLFDNYLSVLTSVIKYMTDKFNIPLDMIGDSELETAFLRVNHLIPDDLVEIYTLDAIRDIRSMYKLYLDTLQRPYNNLKYWFTDKMIKKDIILFYSLIKPLSRNLFGYGFGNDDRKPDTPRSQSYSYTSMSPYIFGMVLTGIDMPLVNTYAKYNPEFIGMDDFFTPTDPTELGSVSLDALINETNEENLDKYLGMILDEIEHNENLIVDDEIVENMYGYYETLYDEISDDIAKIQDIETNICQYKGNRAKLIASYMAMDEFVVKYDLDERIVMDEVAQYTEDGIFSKILEFTGNIFKKLWLYKMQIFITLIGIVVGFVLISSFSILKGIIAILILGFLIKTYVINGIKNKLAYYKQKASDTTGYQNHPQDMGYTPQNEVIINCDVDQAIKDKVMEQIDKDGVFVIISETYNHFLEQAPIPICHKKSARIDYLLAPKLQALIGQLLINNEISFDQKEINNIRHAREVYGDITLDEFINKQKTTHKVLLGTKNLDKLDKALDKQLQTLEKTISKATNKKIRDIGQQPLHSLFYEAFHHPRCYRNILKFVESGFDNAKFMGDQQTDTLIGVDKLNQVALNVRIFKNYLDRSINDMDQITLLTVVSEILKNLSEEKINMSNLTAIINSITDEKRIGIKKQEYESSALNQKLFEIGTASFSGSLIFPTRHDKDLIEYSAEYGLKIKDSIHIISFDNEKYDPRMIYFKNDEYINTPLGYYKKLFDVRDNINVTFTPTSDEVLESIRYNYYPKDLITPEDFNTFIPFTFLFSRKKKRYGDDINSYIHNVFTRIDDTIKDIKKTNKIISNHFKTLSDRIKNISSQLNQATKIDSKYLIGIKEFIRNGLITKPDSVIPTNINLKSLDNKVFDSDNALQIIYALWMYIQYGSETDKQELTKYMTTTSKQFGPVLSNIYDIIQQLLTKYDDKMSVGDFLFGTLYNKTNSLNYQIYLIQPYMEEHLKGVKVYSRVMSGLIESFLHSYINREFFSDAFEKQYKANVILAKEIKDVYDYIKNTVFSIKKDKLQLPFTFFTMIDLDNISASFDKENLMDNLNYIQKKSIQTKIESAVGIWIDSKYLMPYDEGNNYPTVYIVGVDIHETDTSVRNKTIFRFKFNIESYLNDNNGKIIVENHYMNNDNSYEKTTLSLNESELLVRFPNSNKEINSKDVFL